MSVTGKKIIIDDQAIQAMCKDKMIFSSFGKIYLERFDSKAQHLSSESEDEGNDEEWNEMEQDQESVRCLFCVENIDSIDLAIQHLNTEHHFNLNTIKRKFNMDQYSYIKMINYIRLKNAEASVIASIDSQVWNDEVYLKPVEVDAWLMYGKFQLLLLFSWNVSVIRHDRQRSAQTWHVALYSYLHI